MNSLENKEVWKDIPGYEGLYQVSDLGNIKSITRNKILKHTVDKDGRVSIQLSKKGIRKTNKVCRFVALAFIGEKPEGYHVCHIDGDKENNKLSNLRYDIPTENAIDFYRYGSKTSTGILTLKQVIEIRKLYKFNNYSKRELAEKYNVNRTTIRNVINRDTFSWLNDDGTIEHSKTEIC